MTVKEILTKLRTSPTVSVPEAGKVLADLSWNGSYDAARKGTLGVPVFDVGGLKRVASIDVLRRIGLADAASPDPAEARQRELAEDVLRRLGLAGDVLRGLGVDWQEASPSLSPPVKRGRGRAPKQIVEPAAPPKRGRLKRAAAAIEA